MAVDIIQWKGRMGPMELCLSEHTFPPSTVSRLMADAIQVEPDDVVIDIGCGSGVLAIIAAKLGAAHVFAVDISPDVVTVGTENAASQGVADRLTVLRGDLFAPVPEDVAADVIIGDVSGIPDSLAAESGWFPSKIGGGPRGSELPIRMLREARRRLKPGGRLFLPTGSLQDEAAILTAARQAYGALRKVAERMIPLATGIAESASLKELLTAGVIKLIPRGSRMVWEARVWECGPPATV
jgi:release factor glutamine methyltransferase